MEDTGRQVGESQHTPGPEKPEGLKRSQGKRGSHPGLIMESQTWLPLVRTTFSLLRRLCYGLVLLLSELGQAGVAGPHHGHQPVDPRRQQPRDRSPQQRHGETPHLHLHSHCVKGGLWRAEVTIKQGLPCLTWPFFFVMAVHGPVPGCGALPPQGGQGRGLGVQGHLPTTGPGGKPSHPTAHLGRLLV